MGTAINDYVGWSVSGAGDFNGDGLADLLVAASLRSTDGRAENGAVYLVYGKATFSKLLVSDLDQGLGGFAIRGASTSDRLGAQFAWEGGGRSGEAALSSGDFNGDGLSDLLIGAPNRDSNSASNSGAAYVIWGNTTGTANPTSVDLSGTANPDTLTGTVSSETLVGGAGNDTLVGNGGSDVMYGGQGDDVFVLNASNAAALSARTITDLNVARVDGGTGLDTVRLSEGTNLSLGAISNGRITSIERIDMATDALGNSVDLKLSDLLDMTGNNVFNSTGGWTGLAASVTKHQLAITGTAVDKVNTGGDLNNVALWSVSPSGASYAGVTYDVYNSQTSNAQLLIQQGVIVA
jgi:Ca2+-binding RTX toxin-like protein